MLTKLLPDQIANFWDIIKYRIEQSLPPTVGEHPDKMNRILSSCLSGKIQCWASYIRSEDKTKFEGIVLTQVLYDDAWYTKNLLIYCLYGYEEIDKQSWFNGLKSIAKYAKKQGCNQVIAFTDVPYMIEKTKELGGEAKYTLCSFDVEKIVQFLNHLNGE